MFDNLPKAGGAGGKGGGHGGMKKQKKPKAFQVRLRMKQCRSECDFSNLPKKLNKDVSRTTDYYLKVHSAHIKLAQPISA